MCLVLGDFAVLSFCRVADLFCFDVLLIVCLCVLARLLLCSFVVMPFACFMCACLLICAFVRVFVCLRACLCVCLFV